ncbi:MAG: signal peptide peptidase SppA [Thermoprotei archaeon]|nr:MAG: signal peptide peptidase SppA [Thermoprotei archaeon]
MRLSERSLVVISVSLIAVITVATLLLATFRGPPPAPGYVALIEVRGTLSYSQSPLSLLGATADADELLKLLDEALRDDAVKAVVLRINSPGGSAAASEAIYLKVRELAASKPVVAFIEEYGTSGAYMLALPAHEIVAANSSIVGSIGVYMMVVTYSGLLDKLGIKVYIFKSGEFKDVGSPFREPTEAEKRILEEMVSEIFSLFRERVLMHRGDKVANSSEVFSGRPFTAVEALKIGLIDKVGTLEDAVADAKRLAGLPEDAPVQELKPPRPGLLQLLFGQASSTPPLIPSYEVLTMWPPPLTGYPRVSRG